MPKKQDFEMVEVGTVNSEETYAGQCTDGRTIYVQLGVWTSAEKQQGDVWDARYWEDLYNRGCFDTDYAPSVWVK